MDDDDEDNGRDANGRWKKGYCPNPKGRPRKQLTVSQSDVHEFKDTPIDAVLHGKPTKATRHELLLHKMYEQALKGSVMIQRKLFDRFEQSDETYYEGEMILSQLGKRIVKQIEQTGEFDEALYDEYCRFYLMVRRRPHHEAVNERVRRPRNRTKEVAVNLNWRKRPKPQAVLDLERLWAEDEAAEKAARSKPKRHRRHLSRSRE